jgi:ABC-type polysaccharide/polyol phosphate transport system ATPase subunit
MEREKQHCEGTLSCFFELGVGFHPERSAVENVYLHGLLHGLSPAVIRARTDEIIRFAGVEAHRDVPMKCYSAGMNSRLAFAASSIVESDIYIFDEVMAVADEEYQRKCRAHMQSLKEAGKTAIIVSHSQLDLRFICDRIIFLEKGAILREEILENSPQETVATEMRDPVFR